MSLPNIPNITPEISLNRDDVINLLITSIAMEELGLSHIINAEGEKLQYVLGQLPGMTPPTSPTINEILEVNESVRKTLNSTMKNEMFLHSKLESIISLYRFGSAIEEERSVITSAVSAGPNNPVVITTNAFAANTSNRSIEINNAGSAISLPDNKVLNGIKVNEGNTSFIVPLSGKYLISYTVNIDLITGEFIALTINNTIYTPSMLTSISGMNCYSSTIIVALEVDAELSLKLFGNTRDANLYEGLGASLSIVLLE